MEGYGRVQPTEAAVGLDPLLGAAAALLLAQLAPGADLDVVGGLHDVRDVPLRIYLQGEGGEGGGGVEERGGEGGGREG